MIKTGDGNLVKVKIRNVPMVIPKFIKFGSRGKNINTAADITIPELAALSFYLDNQAEINEYIERNRIPDNLVHPAVRKALEAE